MRRRDDSGLTLIELMIAGIILSVVLLAIGGVMVSILTAQRTVAAVTQTATSAQTTATAIATGIRNASDVRLTAPATGDQLLVVRTANTTSTISWSCRAWYYSAATDTIRTKVTTGTAIGAPTSADLDSWALLVSDVTPRTGSTGVFTVVAGGISIAYDAAITNGKPVAIDTTAIKRTGIAEVGTCF